MKDPIFFGLHANPSRKLRSALAILPFILVVGGYISVSYHRYSENADDKLIPIPSKILSAVETMAFQKDVRTDTYLMKEDTIASLKRITIGITISAICGLLLGINMGLFPGMRELLLSFFTGVSIIPPLAILPILFIIVGVDEMSKITLIFVGTFPGITRAVYLATKEIPKEQLTKAATLGASQLGTVYRVVLPQIMPNLINSVRLSLGSAWVYLIGAEAVAATEGLGYRIFLVRRYLAMDVIIPYVLWITLLGFVMDWVLIQVLNHRYKWFGVEDK